MIEKKRSPLLQKNKNQKMDFEIQSSRENYNEIYSGVLRPGYFAKNNFSSIMSLLLPQSVQDMAWRCNVQS